MASSLVRVTHSSLHYSPWYSVDWFDIYSHHKRSYHTAECAYIKMYAGYFILFFLWWRLTYDAMYGDNDHHTSSVKNELVKMAPLRQIVYLLYVVGSVAPHLTLSTALPINTQLIINYWHRDIATLLEKCGLSVLLRHQHYTLFQWSTGTNYDGNKNCLLVYSLE